jgi:nucleoside-diphosphate-sugar epimerase
MKILVTGATGYLGESFVQLLQNKYEMVALVRVNSNIESLEKRDCKIIKYFNDDDILDIFETHLFDGVVHFASHVCVEHAYDDIKSLINSNITFGTLLLEASVKTKVKWFINTGTFWQNYQNESYNPVNLYAATKKAFEDIARYYTETSDLIFTTIKLNDTFGPNDKRAKVFNLWTSVVSSGETLKMSPGEQIIDISYIDDVVDAYEQLIKHLANYKTTAFKNRTFVVTNKEKMTLRELARLFEKATHSKLNIDWGEREYRDREVMSPYSLGESVPGWKQQYTLEDAIRKTVKDLQND